MGHLVTLGGERVGSGKKNKIYLHNYERSTHDLSEKFTSTMGVGMLIPFMCKLATRDDKFEIDLEAGLRTIPTKGPLFGSMKLQLDVYECPLRLYQALLHNNPLAIGLNANQVKWPKMRLYGEVEEDENGNKKAIMAASNSLIKYLGQSGIGTPKESLRVGSVVYRDVFAAGVIAYYDIFKNYYANKQEDNAYQITTTYETAETYQLNYDQLWNGSTLLTPTITEEENDIQKVSLSSIISSSELKLILKANDEVFKNMNIRDIYAIPLKIKYETAGETPLTKTVELTIGELIDEKDYTNVQYIKKLARTWQFLYITFSNQVTLREEEEDHVYRIKEIEYKHTQAIGEEAVGLTSFELKDIDKLRMDILSHHTLGQSYLISENMEEYYPFLENAIGERDNFYWQNPLAGICVKTYQSDIFNNWINTEWIDGENGINAITAISTSDGEFTIDVLQFQEKLYNLLNRVAVSDGTYYGYLDAAYTESDRRFCETPMWIGGMSDEIIFEEIVQTAPADGNPLGTLGGRGNLAGNKKGGKITVKVDEPTLIIGIVSITPRIQYTQGNEWFMTELDNLQDIHVPALDGIGFQNLLAERMHAGAVILNNDGTFEERAVVGKIPAWLEYMTSYDRAFGDFLNNTDAGDGYMIFNRDYLCENGELQDATTYIDPSKYNYAFAYNKLDAQNFWVQIKSHITARRLMSAKQIPTA